MISRTCLYISISLIIVFVSFVAAIVGFYRDVIDIGYCVIVFDVVVFLK